MTTKQLIKKLLDVGLEVPVYVGRGLHKADNVRVEHVGGGRLIVVIEPRAEMRPESFHTLQGEKELQKKLNPIA